MEPFDPGAPAWKWCGRGKNQANLHGVGGWSVVCGSCRAKAITADLETRYYSPYGRARETALKHIDYGFED